MDIQRLLIQFGLSENETRVYLASLELGVDSAQNIAKKAGIKRTTAYSVLDNLIERGLVGKTDNYGKDRFLAEPPEKLLSLLSGLQQQIKIALPQLEAIYNKNEIKPKITFFEGEQAIQNVYDDTLRSCPQEILEWNTNAYFEAFPPDHDYINQRTRLGIKAKRLAGSGSIWHTKRQRNDQRELAETLIVPKEIFWPEVEVNIYGNKVAFMNYAEKISVIIESKAIAEAMRQAYELSWCGGKTVEVK